jgi:hypothetical protein
MLKHTRVRFRQKCDEERARLPVRVLEAELVAQHRFAGSGTALDEVETALQQSAQQDLVEAWNAGRDLAQEAI